MNDSLQATASGAIVEFRSHPAALQNEVGLAQVLQNTLAPPVAYKNGYLEAYGHTIPRDQVGGDLLDLVTTDGNTTAYVADVSGHGFRAGVLMGMVKTAVRYGLLLRQTLPELLDAVNRVLPAVKESTMYATLAALRFNGSCQAEYVTAGHIPLLHYRRRQGHVVRYPMVQFPLGLFDTPGYISTRIPYEPGDIFALVTDGIVEATNDDEAQFGLERLGSILSSLGGLSLSQIFQQTLAAVKQYGVQQDDQTMLLVRAGGRWPQ